jgi:hypothetical protein
VKSVSQLLAFLCTVLLFAVLGVYLFFDQQRVDERTRELKAELSAADAQASTGSSAPEPSAPAATSPGAGTAAMPIPSPSPPPSPPSAGQGAGAPLNDVLKLAAAGSWTRVDALLDTIASTSPAGDSRPGKAVAAARKLVENRDYAAAIDTLTTAQPEEAEGLNLLAYALVREGRAAEAQPYATRSLYLAPRRGASWANAAEIFAEQDNALGASAALKVALYLSRDRARSLAFLSHDDLALQGRKFRAVIREVLQEASAVPSAGERQAQVPREPHA